MNDQNKGLDNWNKRLDHNLEPEKHGDAEADNQAEAFSLEYGSGDQSDDPDKEITSRRPESGTNDEEDNMAKNHPHPSSPEDNLSREE